MKLQIKSKLILTIAFITLLIYVGIVLNINSPKYIPTEDQASQDKLSKAITISKFSIDEGIKELENLEELHKYTNYKKDYILAKLYEKKKDINKSISIYEQLLNENYPLKERVLFHYAYLNSLEGNDKKALKFLNKLLHDFPHSKSVPQTKYFLAQTLLRLKYTKQAINTLLSLKAEYSKTQFGIAANYYLGEDAYNKKNYEEALQFWRQYLEGSPDGRFVNEITSSLESQDKISLLPSDYLLLGNVFFHKKDYKKAAQYYQLGNNPKNYYELGYSLFRINKKNEASKYLKEFAYTFPGSKDSRLALYYGAICTPSYLVKSFWEQATKDIPKLAYYTTYKRALLEDSPKKKEKLLINYIELYPDSLFTLDTVWEIMWQNILDKNYSYAEEFGEKYFHEKNTSTGALETKAKIGFWLGKLAEINNNRTKALKYYKQIKDLHFDNYYSFRANGKYLALTGNKDPMWELQNNLANFNENSWTIPSIITLKRIKTLFGATVAELVAIQQFDEAIELIGKSELPSKRITSWLKALNEEYETSVNIASTLTTQYKPKQNISLWKLAYPLHFWLSIIDTCKNHQDIDPLLVCSLIRQESRFEIRATSISNAKGLMQLIPPTARLEAKQININLNSYELLYDPQINIRLGISYLNGLLKDLNNPLLAVASYNAGPSAIKRWMQKFNKTEVKGDLDFFVEEIPYNQTKDYVKKVFANYWTYLRLYT